MLKGRIFVIVDRQIVGWFVKSLSENGILCVHVIGYSLGYKIIYKWEYGTRFTSFIRYETFGWNTKGTSGCFH